MGKITLWDHCYEKPAHGTAESQHVGARLTRFGMGEAGVRQLLSGDVVSDVRDRLRLATIVHRSLGLTGTQRQVEVGMLIPAVQGISARSAGTGTARTLESLGVGSSAACWRVRW